MDKAPTLQDFTAHLLNMTSKGEKGTFQETRPEVLEAEEAEHHHHHQHPVEYKVNDSILMDISMGVPVDPSLFLNFKLKLKGNTQLKISGKIKKAITSFTLLVESEDGTLFYPKGVLFENSKKPKFVKGKVTILNFKTFNKGKTWLVETSGPFYH